METLDHYVGQLLGALEEQGLADDSWSFSPRTREAIPVLASTARFAAESGIFAREAFVFRKGISFSETVLKKT